MASIQEIGDDIVLGPAGDDDLAAAAREVGERLGMGDLEDCVRNVVCWDEAYAWIVLARPAGMSLPPLQVIDTVNRLLEAHHPDDPYAVTQVRLLPNPAALVFCLEADEHVANVLPLPSQVLANWGHPMQVYHELAAGLVSANKPEIACTVFARALNHNGDFIYDDKFMRSFEMAAIMAGETEVPMLGMTATEAFAVARDMREGARPLPSIHRDYDAVIWQPRTDSDGPDMVFGPVVGTPRPAYVNEAECHWEGALLARTFAAEIPTPDPSIELFLRSSIEAIRSLWPRMSPADQQRLDEFGMGTDGQKISKTLGLPVGVDPEA
jgi:hypothetical protein